MPEPHISDEELLSYLDEQLPVARLSQVEDCLRESTHLRGRLASLARRRDHGMHSVGEIWRRNRLSCPTRSQLGSYLLGALDSDLSRYIDFHIHTVGCRICAANLNDLEQAQQSQLSTEASQRRRKYFESSAGYLPSTDLKD